MIDLALQFPERELPIWEAKYPDHYDDGKVLAAGKCAAARGYLNRNEFLLIANWKSARPARFYERNSAERVIDITKQAFAKAASDIEKVLLLTELEGIRVRTATALLHLCVPSIYPLLDFRALTALGADRIETDEWGELDWLRIWPSYIVCCRTITSQNHCDLRKVDRALWSFGRYKRPEAQLPQKN